MGLALVLAACGTSPDPSSHGEICTPARDDCQARAKLSRSNAGSNILDIAITNEGPPATILFDVDLRDPRDAAGAGDASPTRTGDGPFPVRYQLDRGETTTDRFGPQEIFVRKQLRLRLGCRACSDCSETCRANLEYSYMTEPLECDNDDNCRGDRLCNARTGKCVDCRSDGDCSDEQTCDRRTGRCLPAASGGCRHGSGLPLPLSILAAALLAVLAWRRRRSKDGTPVLPAVAVLAVTLGAVPPPARARPPSSTFTAAAGPRYVTGPLGTDVKRGIGAELHQTLRWRYGGLDFWIETNYFVTTQEAPPLTRELQVFGFGVGPRAYLPIDSFELMAGAGYQRVGLGPNPLVEQTGPDANYHTLGGTVGVGYRFSSFVVRTDAQYFPIIGAEGSLLSINVSFGISTR
ncbi:MAG: hypothetical protein ABEN55_11115 [Bradymonadaceae bacterium]